MFHQRFLDSREDQAALQARRSQPLPKEEENLLRGRRHPRRGELRGGRRGEEARRRGGFHGAGHQGQDAAREGVHQVLHPRAPLHREPGQRHWYGNNCLHFLQEMLCFEV